MDVLNEQTSNLLKLVGKQISTIDGLQENTKTDRISWLENTKSLIDNKMVCSASVCSRALNHLAFKFVDVVKIVYYSFS